jgi:hypothetical protein
MRVLARRAARAWTSERGEVDEQDVGFEAFVEARVGRAAYQAFYRPYAEKVWGDHPARLSQTLAKKRVSTSNPLRLFRGGRRFAYPLGGMTSMIRWLTDRLEQSGVTILTGTTIDPREHDGPVLFSGHLTDITQTELSHRGLYLLFLVFPTHRLSRSDTFYVPERRFWFGRVSEIKNFDPDRVPPGQTILCVEIPQGEWPRDRDFTGPLLHDVLTQLRSCGIVEPGLEPVAVEQRWMPRVYPFYARGWIRAWREAIDQLQRHPSIFPFGRQGLFLHCNLDHCVTMAEDLVGHLLQGRDQRSWLQRADRSRRYRVRD